MKKAICSVLILSLLCALCLSVGCSGTKGAEIYDPGKFDEAIDLKNDYVLVWQDEFDGELDRNIWADTRQGTRRDGFWTLNLAYTDGEGHLVLRTEKRGSRYCSDTREREIAGYDGSRVTLTYDDCNPFGMIAGDFGEIESLDIHTDDPVGYVILDKFDVLGESFDAFMEEFEIPASSETFPETEDLSAYTPFYDTAMELFNYYSFVAAVKNTKTTLDKSALVGINRPYAMTFGTEVDPQSVDLRAALGRLFGFDSEEIFVACAQELADLYATYRSDLENGAAVNEAIENGCFQGGEEDFIFPIAFDCGSVIVLTYVIVDHEGLVSVWVNDIASALKATNLSAAYYTGATVNNATYCKNVLFVTGPEGVYSGALRTMPIKDHEGNVKCEGYTHGFGYYEIRCKLPSVNGIWHAFWMMCGNVYSVENGSVDGVEIDIFEYLPARDAVNVALHWDGYDEAHQNDHKRYEKTHFATGEYHTFGMNWDENGYAFYIDGKKVYSTTGGGVCDQEGYLKISTEYGEWGDWVGSLDIGDLPVDWVIDYVRVYDKK